MSIDLVIPIFKEAGLGDTLGKLFEQNVIDDVQIIVVEYDPDKKELGKRIVEKFNEVNNTNIRYLTVNRPGIAYARHVGIMTGQAPIIVNFDGDARFEHANGILRMTTPIITGAAVLTCCNNIWDEKEIPTEKAKEMQWMKVIMDQLSKAQSNPLYSFLEPGSAIAREAYMFVGGFDDVQKWELLELSGRLFYNYPTMKKYVSDVNVIVSPRRVLNWTNKTFSMLDYEKFNPRIENRIK